MKRILLFSVLLWLSLEAKGVDIVHDPGIAAQNQGNEVVNLGHWMSTEAHTLNTELNTLAQYENMVVQLARFGDPAALKNLPGIGTVAELYGSGQQLLGTYQRIQTIAVSTPRNLQNGLGSLQSVYSLQRWNPMNPGAYQFPVDSYSICATVQQEMLQLEQQRQNLEKQRDQALSSLQSANTASDVQKYHATVSGLNGALAEVAARANELAQKSQLQQQQLNAGAQVQRLQATEQVVAGYGQDVNSSVSTLQNLSNGYGKFPQWPNKHKRKL